MIWLQLIGWVIGRGLVSGAVVGTLLGALFASLYTALIGLLIGGIIGAILGLVDGLLLALITKFTYAPINNGSRYSKLVYTVPILINTSPMFILCMIGVVNPFTWDNALRTILIGSIPITIMGVITAYFARGFIEYTDSLMAQIPSRQLPANVLS